MKGTILAVIASFVALTAAQSLSSLPQCAQTCVGNSFGGCSALDIKCICANTNLISQLSCCVATKCPPADQQATIKFASQLCAADGVTLPTSASCAASSSSTASSSGATGGAAAPVSTGVNTSTMASSMMSSTMSGSMTSTSSATAATGSSSAPQTSSASGSSPAAASPSTGGGAHLLGSSKVGAAGAAIAALVLL